jgi:hypothetical protein
MSEPVPIPSARWRGDLAFLREIPADERPRYRLAPPEMSYAEANRWARRSGCDRVIPLSSGETLVRLREEPASPWALP